MNWRRLTTCVPMGKVEDIIVKRRDLEEELCRRIKIINQLEEEILELWENLNSLNSRRERQTQSLIVAKERYEKVSRDRQFMIEEFQRIELDLKTVLKKKKKTLLEKIEAKLRVKELTEQKAAIERKCEVLWEMIFCLDQREERREWKENLRRTRSQSDMVHTVPKPATGKAFQGQGLAEVK